ncbi:uncharacterized protein [Temnothorax longispinosus]|uniref:uncharacterized protein n=1 Tax=Temnothorax longispinosus TaxID=300112 RepID=UPI003A98FFE8
MIEQNAVLPDVQKMQYLMSSLKGEAHDVVSSLEASAENYKEAWTILMERYDDPGLIIGRHVKALFELLAMIKDNHVILRKLLDTVLKHIRALKALKRPTNNWDDLMIHLVTSRLDQSTYQEWETTVVRSRISSFEELINFLNQRCRALEATARSSKSTSSQKKTLHNKSTTANVSTTKNTCAFCQQENHAIYKCKEFLALNIDQRVKEARTRKLCLNCLKCASHQAKECLAGTCRKCSKRHNTLLHFEQASKNNSDSEPKTEKSENKESTSPATVNHAAINQVQVLLATALVNVPNTKGETKSIHALLDSGSQSCFITEDCCTELGVKRQSTNMPICGLGGQAVSTRSLVKIIIQSRTTGYRKQLDCLVVDTITHRLPINEISKSDIRISRGITLADPQFNQTSKINLLIEAEIFFDLLCIGRIKVTENQPTWQKTVLGWIASGNCITGDQYMKSTVCNMSINDQLNASLMKFWQLESCERIATRTPEKRAFENHFMQTHKRDSEGRFVVTLPIKMDVLKNLGESKEIAVQQLHSLERRLKRQPQFTRKYVEFMREYQRLGHMRELQEPVSDEWPCVYLPHHYVIKESSTTTRLRVVFNASSPTTSGVSLNQTLMVGPVVQPDVTLILIRF